MASTGQIMAALNKVASQQVEFAARQDQMGCQIEKNNAQLSLGILSKSTSQANNKFWFGMGSTFLPFAVSGISSFLKLDAETTKKATEKVMSVANPIHDDMVIIRFNNDVVNENTFDHPYYVKDKGWCSHRPELTKERYDIDTELLEVGDVCYYNDGVRLEEVEVSFIRENWGEVQTYTIDELESGNTFFANGIVVHNEGI